MSENTYKDANGEVLSEGCHVSKGGQIGEVTECHKGGKNLVTVTYGNRREIQPSSVYELVEVRKTKDKVTDAPTPAEVPKAEEKPKTTKASRGRN